MLMRRVTKQGTHLVPLHPDEQANTLEADERRFRSHGFRLIVHVERLCPPTELLEHHSDAASDCGIRRVQLQGLAEVVLGEGGLACLEVDVPEAKPGKRNTRYGAASTQRSVGAERSWTDQAL